MGAAPNRRFRVGHPFRTRRKMCGICGEVTFDGSAAGGCIAAMTERMHARGPDAGGAFMQDRVAFGHRRLAIIDLAAASQQPMVDPQLGLAIVFNGCIYNYRELRNALAAKGYRFFSEGDTEVILKAYAEWGPRCVERFYGMFAFAIWERNSGRVVLARDRLGIKPLYYTERPGRLRFASTLPALLAAGGVDTSIDPAALHHYMSLHAVVPAPLTIYKGREKAAGGDDLHHRARRPPPRGNLLAARGRPARARSRHDRSGLAGSDPVQLRPCGRAAARRRRSGRGVAVGRARQLDHRRFARRSGPERFTHVLRRFRDRRRGQRRRVSLFRSDRAALRHPARAHCRRTLRGRSMRCRAPSPQCPSR